MKIVDLTKFLLLPSGTIYSRYKPTFFTGLEMKLDSLMPSRDWFYKELIAPVGGDFQSDCQKMENGEEVEYSTEEVMRDGCFEEELMFLVYSDEDTRAMAREILGIAE